MVQITIPKNGTNTNIDIEKSIIFLWANWCGKTRLWSWIELEWPQKNNIHRISAQKSLKFPDEINQRKTEENAHNDLLFWHPKWWHQYKLWHKRWNNPNTHLINDYEKLVNLLFAEHYGESTRYREEAKTSQAKPEIHQTKIDIIKNIWEKILPQKELIVENNTISTKNKWTWQWYKASEMSDWERVIFYLIGQCLSAQASWIIVVDEPELHLHKSIQYSLRNEVEKQRSDCTFIYLTHDVDFASSKKNAKKIRLKSYDWTNRNREEYEDISWIPEELQLEIIWNKQKVLFVEWNWKSLDTELYKEIFPNFLIKPAWWCGEVIKYVKAFKENSQFTNMEFYGLIDRDRRNNNQISDLSQNNVYVLEVAEIENIFIVPELLNIICEMNTHDISGKNNEVIDAVITFLEQEKDKQIALRMKETIKSVLNWNELSESSIAELQISLNWLMWSIDFEAIKQKETNTINELITTRDYKNILKIYNRKSLWDRISSTFWLTKWELQSLILRSIKNESWRQKIIDWVKLYIPNELTQKIEN